MFNYMFRSTITDMHEKYCGNCYDFHLIQNGGAAEGRHLCILASSKVNIVAVTTILVLHVVYVGKTVWRTGSDGLSLGLMVGLNMFYRALCCSPSG